MRGLNLLPWRETLRAQRRREFLRMLVGCSTVALLMLVLLHTLISRQMEDQMQINRYLKQEIKHFDQQIKVIAVLKQQKKQLLAKLQLMQQLQVDRALVVRLYDVLVRVVPQDVLLVRVIRKGSKVILIGKAESTQAVARLIHNLDADLSFSNPKLVEIKTDAQERGKKFKLQFSLKSKWKE